jgi:hypothetical protein
MKLKMISLLMVSGLIALFQPALHSETNTVEPAGELKQVDTSKDITAMEQLLGSDKKAASATAEKVEASPSNYSPPVYYAMSAHLFSKGENDLAMRWFYAGQVRARYDANRCNDKSARSAVGVLNQKYGPQINQHGFKDIEKLEKIVRDAVAWSLSTPHSYDHRWINLHGMGAFTGSSSDTPSLPESEWEEIKKSTHSKYLEGFEKAMKQMKENS